MTGNDVYNIRQVLNLTQQRLAEYCNMAQPEIARAEAKKHKQLTKGTTARIQLGLKAHNERQCNEPQKVT